MTSPAALLVGKLLQKGESLYTGRTSDGVQFGRAEDNLLALGPTRCGKTAGLIIPSVAVHPGPVIVTSTRSDIVAATLQARRQVAEQRGGLVVEVALGGHTSGKGPAVTWSATDGCDDWNTALDRAFTLASTAMPNPPEPFWRDAATDLLAGSLFGAALIGENDSVMARRIRLADVSHYQNVISELCPEGHDATLVFQGLVDSAAMATETRRVCCRFS